MEWQPIETAPKDGSKFIGLLSNGLILKTHWQAYNVYMPRSGGGHYVSGKRYDWSCETDDALIGGDMIGWIPIPALPTE